MCTERIQTLTFHEELSDGPHNLHYKCRVSTVSVTISMLSPGAQSSLTIMLKCL